MRLLLALLIATTPPTITAAQWPVLNSPRMVSCGDSGGANSPCDIGQTYENNGVIFIDVGRGVGTPSSGPNVSTGVRPAGVRCAGGNAMTGRLPFTSCFFRYENYNRPQPTGKCELKNMDSWELTADSTCDVVRAWGGQQGAGPGAECIVFTNTTNSSQRSAVNTPWGVLSAEQVANSGGQYCNKSLPPNVTCELRLPSLIDHGDVRVGELSKREDEGSIECGSSPKIDLLVNGDRDSGGVRITATASVINKTTVRITSEISVGSNAVTGVHSATYVFVASPY